MQNHVAIEIAVVVVSTYRHQLRESSAGWAAVGSVTIMASSISSQRCVGVIRTFFVGLPFLHLSSRSIGIFAAVNSQFLRPPCRWQLSCIEHRGRVVPETLPFADKLRRAAVLPPSTWNSCQVTLRS